MKQRQHRRAVQRRMAAAPDQWTRERLMYLGFQWSKRDLRALAKRKAVPLEFNRIELSRPPTRANSPAA